MRRLALTALLASLVAAPAAGFVKPVTLAGDLDGDPELEQVRAVRVDVEGVDDPFDRTAIRVQDSCAGQAIDRRVAGPQDNLARLRLKPIDPRGGREIFVDLRSGASGRLGEARVVAWRSDPSLCRRPRSLFAYLSERPTRPPRGALREVSFFNVRLRNLTRRYRGTELVLVERFLTRGDPVCCGSIRKTTLFGYRGSRDRYVAYDRTVRRNTARE